LRRPRTDRPAVSRRLPRFVPLTLRAEMDKIRGQNTRRSARGAD
jgi:hypothetical protein